MSRVNVAGMMPFEFLEMKWAFSADFKRITSFQNNAPDQTVTISKRQLFVLLSVIAMSYPRNPNHPNNPNSNIGNWLSGFDANKSTGDDCFLTTQENSGQKEDQDHLS